MALSVNQLFFYTRLNKPLVLNSSILPNGYYEFVGLDPDTYYVGFSNLPAGYEFTSQDAGTDEAVDSDADPVNGDTEPVTLVAGQNYPDLDAGIYTDRAGLGNYVWDDLDNDGVQDANEEGIPGITVTLYAVEGDNLSMVTELVLEYFT